MRLNLGSIVLRMAMLAFVLVSSNPADAQNTPNLPVLERQLNQRVDEYFKLLVNGEWRAVQNYITEDSQDTWFTQAKAKIDSYEVQEVKLSPNGKEAEVVVMVTFHIPPISAPFHQPRRTKWTLDKEKWVVSLPPPVSLAEMFPQMFRGGGDPANPAPPPALIAESPLRFEQNPIRLSPPAADSDITVVTVPFQNVSSSPVTVLQLGSNCPCLQVATDKNVFQPNEKGVLRVRYRAPSGERPANPPLVQATLAPTMFLLDIPVELSGP